MNDAEAMKTYVAVINGEVVIAFRAMDDDDAHDLVSDEDGDVQQSLNDSGIVRADGSPLWDGKSEIIVRPATEAEDESWRQASDADDGEPEEEPEESIDAEDDSEIEGASDDDVVYLIPVKLAGHDEGEVAAD